jgi:hypothetical protein
MAAATATANRQAAVPEIEPPVAAGGSGNVLSDFRTRAIPIPIKIMITSVKNSQP